MPRAWKQERHNRKPDTQPRPSRRQLLTLSNWRSTITTPTAHPPPATSFHTLPHELRQQILLQTFDTTSPFSDLSCHVARARVDDMERWAAILRLVNPCFIGDVDFVVGKWNEVLKEVFTKQRETYTDRLAALKERLPDDEVMSWADLDECIRELMAIKRLKCGHKNKTYAGVLRG
ncbi:hypothetical protein E2P81_ATG05704 [Venturia nashicola]|uniref:Uncharacterized protein n=1 Tax=Venturia nashicola TaxID=86259 RepID=A0A4Z1NRH9_9PEZI|nr:hypothetical protein E6O75_ATG05843 [Venturia nashicola]TLD29410.1 hypothetical protein E2P81_ATG05704 [Venturia nashicola]